MRNMWHTQIRKKKQIEDLEFKIQNMELQYGKIDEEMETKQDDLKRDLENKDRQIQNMESKHEELIMNTE